MPHHRRAAEETRVDRIEASLPRTRGEEEVVYVLRETPLPKSEAADDAENSEAPEDTETAAGDKPAEQPSGEMTK